MTGVLRRAVLGGLAASAGAGAAWAHRPAKRPDLQGTWSLATYTDIERPPGLHALVLTPAEAEAYEAPRRRLHGMPAPAADDLLGQTEAEFNERGDGLARVRGQIRSSLVIEPPDGTIPFTAAGLAAVAKAKAERTANPEDLTASTRCLTNATAGAPMAGGPDAPLFQLVQTPDAVVIFTECRKSKATSSGEWLLAALVGSIRTRQIK